MQRTQIYLTKKEVQALQQLRQQTGHKKSEIIRNALDIFIEEKMSKDKKTLLKSAKGLWKDNDGYSFEEVRSSWDR